VKRERENAALADFTTPNDSPTDHPRIPNDTSRIFPTFD
jgi:hypothetical protein